MRRRVDGCLDAQMGAKLRRISDFRPSCVRSTQFTMRILWISSTTPTDAEDRYLIALSGMSVHVAGNVSEAIAILGSGQWDAAVGNIPRENSNGERGFRELHPTRPGLMLLFGDSASR